MKKIIFIFLLLMNQCFAQKHDYVWTFGYSNAYPYLGGTNINFNVNPPDTDYVKRDINFDWDCGSICDTHGKLLFMTNGCKIYNGKNKQVKNGNGLNPSIISTNYCDYGNLITQGSLFLPNQKDTNIYYLFHIRPEFVEKDNLGGIGDKIYYTVLDKSKNNGDGEVLSKNNIIHEDTIAFGKMTAVRHANGQDWWIIVPRMLQNRYIKFLFKGDTILGPYFQDIGFKNDDDNGTGQSVFSPDGTKFIHFDRYNDLNIFDFDRCSGELSNAKRIMIPTAKDSFIYKEKKYPVYTVGGVAVSPNSKLLYVTTQKHVFQYNLKSADIISSATLIAKFDSFYVNNTPTAFLFPHIAPDNKIYINCTSTLPYLHVINEPDKEGIACNLTQHSFRLQTYNSRSIPNFPNFRLGAAATLCNNVADKDIEKEKINIKLYPNPTDGTFTLDIGERKINSLAIYDVNGRLVASQVVDNQMIVVDVAHLKNGVYICRFVGNEKEIMPVKFTVIH